MLFPGGHPIPRTDRAIPELGFGAGADTDRELAAQVHESFVDLRWEAADENRLCNSGGVGSPIRR